MKATFLDENYIFHINHIEILNFNFDMIRHWRHPLYITRKLL